MTSTTERRLIQRLVDARRHPKMREIIPSGTAVVVAAWEDSVASLLDRLELYPNQHCFAATETPTGVLQIVGFEVFPDGTRPDLEDCPIDPATTVGMFFDCLDGDAMHGVAFRNGGIEAELTRLDTEGVFV